MVFRGTVSIDAAPTGLRSVRLRFSTEIPSLRDSGGFLKSSRFPRRIRFGWETEPTGPGAKAVIFSYIDTYGSVRKPNLPGRGMRRLFFLKLTPMVRFQTAPTGPGDYRFIFLNFMKPHLPALRGFIARYAKSQAFGYPFARLFTFPYSPKSYRNYAFFHDKGRMTLCRRGFKPRLQGGLRKSYFIPDVV